jgi:hypothetical protein
MPTSQSEFPAAKPVARFSRTGSWTSRKDVIHANERSKNR